MSFIITGKGAFKEKVVSGDIIIAGDKTKFSELSSLLDKFEPSFKIMDR